MASLNQFVSFIQQYYDETPESLSYKESEKCLGVLVDELHPSVFWNITYELIVEEKENGTSTGSPCNREHQECKSGYCSPYTEMCEEQPYVCPDVDLAILGGYSFDPFCRTLADWCKVQDVDTLVANFQEIEGLQCLEPGNLGEDACATAAICMYLDFELLVIINETNADFTHYNISDTNAIEDALLDPWTYYTLLWIAVVGSVAVLSMLVGLLGKYNNTERPRDYRTKCAAENKIANLIENSLSMHAVKDARSSKGQTMASIALPCMASCLILPVAIVSPSLLLVEKLFPPW